VESSEGGDSRSAPRASTELGAGYIGVDMHSVRGGVQEIRPDLDVLFLVRPESLVSSACGLACYVCFRDTLSLPLL